MSVYHFSLGHTEPTKEDFMRQLVDSPPAVYGLDCETISLRERQPLVFAIATSPIEAWCFDVYPEYAQETNLVKPLLNNPNSKKAIHNAMFDLKALPLVLGSLDRSNIADTNVMARLLGRTNTKLFELAPEVDREIVDADTLIKQYGGKTMLDVPVEARAKKCANDAMVHLALYHKYNPYIKQDYFKPEMEAIPILIDMSLRGIKVNQEDRAKEEARLEAEVAHFKQICEEEDFNPGSNQQVGYILAKRGNFLPLTKSKKSLSVDEDQLEFLDDPLAAVVLKYRKYSKLLSTYIKPLKDEDRIYTSYSMDIIVGRVQSSDRNMQNIPPETRYIFEPDSGVFTTGDFSQEHLRIIMHFSDDKEMRRVYEDGDFEGDIHAKTAHELNVPRRIAKQVNFAIPYGGTPRTLSYTAKIRDLRKCSRFLDGWFETYRDAAAWIRGAKEYAVKTGKTFPTLFGREFFLDMNERQDEIERKGVNYPILGSDGEIMKRALIRCAKDHLPLTLQVHDSITCDGDIVFPVEDLEHISPVRIPFEVKQTYRWE